MLSRDRAEDLEVIEVNGASQEIISQIREKCLKFVRLFRFNTGLECNYIC